MGTRTMERNNDRPIYDLSEALLTLCADPDHPGFKDRGDDPTGHEKTKSKALDQIPSWCDT